MRVKIKTYALAVLTLSLLFWGEACANETDLAWGTFLAGDEEGWGIAVDDAGNAYVAGHTGSEDFPTTVGAFDTTYNGEDAFVVKFNATGSALIYATFLGGSDWDLGHDVAIDDSGNAYVTGGTGSWDFPTTAGSFDTTYNEGPEWGDAFVVKLDPSGGALVYGTFLGGSFAEENPSIALDRYGNAYVVGMTSSWNFPTTPGAFDRTYNDVNVYTADAFVAQLNAEGSALVYGTFLGGRDQDWAFAIALDDSSNAYVTGSTRSTDFPITAGAFDTSYNGSSSEWRVGGDVFVAKINPTGSALDYATFLGGSSIENGRGIAVDDSGNAYVTGGTQSWDFPTTPGALDSTYGGGSIYGADAYIVKLNAAGSDLIYATYVGGYEDEAGWDIALTESGSACVAGYTESPDFPTTYGAFETKAVGSREIFILQPNFTGSALEYSTLLGGSNQDRGFDIAVDGSGSAYVTGITASADFPTTPGAFDDTYHGGSWWGDAFVAKFNSTGDTLVYATYLGGTSWNTQVVSENPVTNLPETYFLHQNYPNPFNANTEIRYQVPEDGHVTLNIFNSFGQQVRALKDAHQHGGEYTVNWDGRDEMGQEVASGLYFCRLKAGEFGKTIKMVLMR
jgi:hypothetical protein